MASIDQSNGARKKLTRASRHTGERYAFLTVLSPAEHVKKVRMYSCRCVCGSVKSYDLTELRKGRTISCGCMDYIPFTDLSVFPKTIQEKTLSRIGTKKGSLTILAFTHWMKGPWYRMRCRCGKEAVLQYRANLKSCGCQRLDKIQVTDPLQLPEPWPAYFREDQGKVFGKLTVETYEYMYNGVMFCRCRCACGNEYVVSRKRLLSGAATSCGCDPYGYAGRQFSWLTAVRYEDGAWLCRCKCGNEVRVPTSQLRTGAVRSCGCMRKARGAGMEKVDMSLENTLPHLAMRAVRNALESRDDELLGVKFHQGKYTAVLTFQKKKYFLGRFETLEEAAAARRAAVKKYVVPWVERFQEELADDYYAGVRAIFRDINSEQEIEPRTKEKAAKKTPIPVAQYTPEGELVRIYCSCLEASRIVGASPEGIAYAANGWQKTCGGYIWKYADPEEEQP